MLPLPVNRVGTNIGEQGCELAHGLSTKVTTLEGGSTEQLVKELIGGPAPEKLCTLGDNICGVWDERSWSIWGLRSLCCGTPCPSMKQKVFSLRRQLRAVPAQGAQHDWARVLRSWEWAARGGDYLWGVWPPWAPRFSAPPLGQARCEDKTSGFQT